jgi:MerR family transcriptional regulator, copper efflux regulator
MTITVHVNVNMKSSPVGELTIGQLADHFGLATHVLRHWESVGLLHPVRRVNGRRRYTEDDLTRVAIIVHGRQVGFSLDELRVMLTADEAATRREVLRRHRDELERRIAQAQASKAVVDHALACTHDDFMSCPNFRQLVHAQAGCGGPAGARPPAGGDALAGAPA